MSKGKFRRNFAANRGPLFRTIRSIRREYRRLKRLFD
jgi:hypothetical protein